MSTVLAVCMYLHCLHFVFTMGQFHIAENSSYNRLNSSTIEPSLVLINFIEPMGNDRFPLHSFTILIILNVPKSCL